MYKTSLRNFLTVFKQKKHIQRHRISMTYDDYDYDYILDEIERSEK